VLFARHAAVFENTKGRGIMHDHVTIHRSRTAARAVVVVSIVVTLLSVSATAADAAAPQPKVHVHLQGAVVQFTDCPFPGPVDIACHASQFNLFSVDTHVGSQFATYANINGGVVDVTLHPDGTFDTSAPIAVGQVLVKRIEMGGLDRARYNTTVPLSDGSEAVLDVTLTGIGDVSTFTFPDVVAEPLCPSGVANETITRNYRSVTEAGTVTFHGIPEVPIDIVQPAFLLQERDEGTCTAP